jgi:hypothetical protein
MDKPEKYSKRYNFTIALKDIDCNSCSVSFEIVNGDNHRRAFSIKEKESYESIMQIDKVYRDKVDILVRYTSTKQDPAEDRPFE